MQYLVDFNCDVTTITAQNTIIESYSNKSFKKKNIMTAIAKAQNKQHYPNQINNYFNSFMC